MFRISSRQILKSNNCKFPHDENSHTSSLETTHISRCSMKFSWLQNAAQVVKEFERTHSWYKWKLQFSGSKVDKTYRNVFSLVFIICNTVLNRTFFFENIFNKTIKQRLYLFGRGGRGAEGVDEVEAVLHAREPRCHPRSFNTNIYISI